MKSAGLDNIPNKLLKMAASIVSPFLTQIFAKSIETGICPDEWKLAKERLLFSKRTKGMTLTIIDQYLSY